MNRTIERAKPRHRVILTAPYAEPVSTRAGNGFGARVFAGRATLDLLPHRRTCVVFRRGDCGFIQARTSTIADGAEFRRGNHARCGLASSLASRGDSRDRIRFERHQQFTWRVACIARRRDARSGHRLRGHVFVGAVFPLPST